jgi:hypothetical protein
MQIPAQLPTAFSVRDDHEFYPVQHLLARINPQLMVVQVATGRHVHGGPTVFWGLVYLESQALTAADVEAALVDAGFDLQQNGAVQTFHLMAGQPAAVAREEREQATSLR